MGPLSNSWLTNDYLNTFYTLLRHTEKFLMKIILFMYFMYYEYKQPCIIIHNHNKLNINKEQKSYKHNSYR